MLNIKKAIFVLILSLHSFLGASALDVTKIEYKVKKGDSLMSILNRNKIEKDDIHKLVYKTKNSSNIQKLSVGQKITIYKGENGNLVRLLLSIDKRNVYIASNKDNSFTIKKGYYKSNEVNRYKIGTVKYSLNKTLSEMGLTSAQKKQFKDMFSTQIDFRKIRKGSKLVATYNEYYQGKELLYSGELIAAEVDQNGKIKQAFKFKDHTGVDGYFTKNGMPLTEGFNRIPIESYKRMSSAFHPARKHPVLGTIRAHNGTDYSAKKGTPIYAAASGKIALKDYQKNGYGNVIVINHASGYSTLYAHMSKTKKGIYSGKNVKKGDIIGYVGSTGISTGNHLHFELRKNGVYLDSEKENMPSGNKIAKKDVGDFKSLIQSRGNGFKIAKKLSKEENKTSFAIRKK